MRFLSQVYTIARGSVGGITYTANQWYQLIARARTAPVQPNTSYQTGIRSAFDVADDAWRSLSPELKDGWNDYAATCIYSGPLGNYTVPGRQLFIGTYSLALYAKGINPELGIIVTSSIPTIAGWFNPGDVHAEAYTGGTQGIKVVVSNPPNDDAIVVIDVSIAFNDTRRRYKGPYISSAKTVVASPAGTTLFQNIDRPAATLGKYCFTRTRLFTAKTSPPAAPHRLSTQFYLRHKIEPPVGASLAAAARKKVAKVAA